MPMDRPKYASRVGNFTPINPIDLSEETGLTLDEVLAFFDTQFGGFEKYVAACADREELGRQLARLNWPPACRHGVKGPCGECQARI